MQSSVLEMRVFGPASGTATADFLHANFVLGNFGYLNTVLALLRNDRVVNGRGIWRSTDGGSNWSKVYAFPPGEAVGQIVWALGSDHLVYAAGGNALAISKRRRHDVRNRFSLGTGRATGSQSCCRVAERARRSVALCDLCARRERDVSFARRRRDVACRPRNSAGYRRPGQLHRKFQRTQRDGDLAGIEPLAVYVVQNGSTPATLHVGNYVTFLAGEPSYWSELVLPSLSSQDSGNVFLATTQKGGALLFYGAQRSVAYMGPLYPSASTDWRALGPVHVDLHGILLSPDFRATLIGGVYTPESGTVWLLSDGGIYWSTDGGQTFVPAKNAMTLSCVNVAGVSYQGLGPALSLNTGDNDGFYSMDGGQTWSNQEYGGGDNDCSFADPLRPYSMMVFTPRWGHTVSVYETVPGSLPDARTSQQRRASTGPPLMPDSGDIWNANSYYGNRGSRPIVLGLPNENAPAQGDYVFILFKAAAQRVVVRTQNIFDIASSNEWITSATGPGQGSNVYLQGPPLPGPLTSVLQAAGGHANTVFYAGRLSRW